MEKNISTAYAHFFYSSAGRAIRRPLMPIIQPLLDAYIGQQVALLADAEHYYRYQIDSDPIALAASPRDKSNVKKRLLRQHGVPVNARDVILQGAGAIRAYAEVQADDMLQRIIFTIYREVIRKSLTLETVDVVSSRPARHGKVGVELVLRINTHHDFIVTIYEAIGKNCRRWLTVNVRRIKAAS